MGKIAKTFYDAEITPEPSRNANRIRTYEAPNGEVTIHFRNLKIVLHSREEVEEWKQGFAEAREKFMAGDYFKNDL